MTTSILEALNTDRTVPDKSRFLDYFVGDSVKSWWTQEQIVGTGTTFTMQDEIDGGVKILLDGTSGDHGGLTFNDKRPFEPTGCIITFQARRVLDSANAILVSGFRNNPSSGNDRYNYIDDGGDTFKKVVIQNTSSTSTNLPIHINLQWNNFRGELTSTSAISSLNDTLYVTQTGANLPNTILQPSLECTCDGAVANDCRYRNCEVWNT